MPHCYNVMCSCHIIEYYNTVLQCYVCLSLFTMYLKFFVFPLHRLRDYFRMLGAFSKDKIYVTSLRALDKDLPNVVSAFFDSRGAKAQF